MVSLLGALVACSRGTSSGGSNEPNRWSFKPAKNETNWQVKCDALCDVKAKAPTLEALCTQVAAAAKPTIGSSKCEARKSIGYPAIPASAVSDAAIARDCPNLAAVAAYFQPRHFEQTFASGLEMLLQGMVRLRNKP